MHRLNLSIFLCLVFLSAELVGLRSLVAEDAALSVKESAAIEIGGVNVVMPGPTLSQQVDASKQGASLKPILAGLSMRQFTRNSVVAPVRIKLKYIKDDSGNRVGHDVHLAFVAYAPIDEFSDDKLSSRMFGQKDDAEVDSSDSAAEVSAEELASVGIKDSSERVRYQRFTFDLLEKVQLSGVIRAEHSESEAQRRIDLVLDERFPSGWKLIADPDDSIEDTNAYSGGRAWIAVTELSAELTGGKEAVLIESRIVLHEPEGWFAGSNFLRSKLPLVLQESARNLRRGLK